MCVCTRGHTYIHTHTWPSCLPQDLLNIAMTTLSSKILTGDKHHFAKLAVDAILRLRGACCSPHSASELAIYLLS